MLVTSSQGEKNDDPLRQPSQLFRWLCANSFSRCLNTAEKSTLAYFTPHLSLLWYYTNEVFPLAQHCNMCISEHFSACRKHFPAHETEKINYMSQVAYDFIVADRERIDVLCLLVTKLQESFVKDTGMLTYNAWGFSTVLAWLVLLFDRLCVSEDDRTLSPLQFTGIFHPFYIRIAFTAPIA